MNISVVFMITPHGAAVCACKDFNYNDNDHDNDVIDLYCRRTGHKMPRIRQCLTRTTNNEQRGSLAIVVDARSM